MNPASVGLIAGVLLVAAVFILVTVTRNRRWVPSSEKISAFSRSPSGATIVWRTVSPATATWA